MLTRTAWQSHPGLRHGFLEAEDCAAAPDWPAVVQAPIALPRQVHGAAVVAADRCAGRPEGDAVVTQPSLPLAGILTADCVPVLLVHRHGGAAAAVHAGWRGAAAGVLEATIDHLRATHQIPLAELSAAIGPAIGPCCYRVGPEVRTAFEARTDTTTAPAWEQKPDGLYLDLRLAVRHLLERAGVNDVDFVGGCTRCDPRLHSYRRDGARAGRQLSFIGWE
jgi:polyphenol oxidase